MSDLGREFQELLRPLVDDAVDRVRAELEQSMRHLAPRVVTATEAGRLLGVSERTIRRLIEDGRLPTVPHVGDRVLVPVAAIDAFVADAVKPLTRRLKAAAG